jgi:hypothetical protein
MAINFTAADVEHGYLVVAKADVQIVLTGVGARTIAPDTELCLFWLRDRTAGAVGTRGVQGTTMLITGYYVQNPGQNDPLIRANCTPNVAGYPPRAFPDPRTKGNVFDADAVMDWHNNATSSLLHWACVAEGVPTMAGNPMPAKQLYKGSRLKGKQETPEAYLAMAFKQGIHRFRTVESNRHHGWTARNVYEYGLKVAGLA